MTENRLSVPTNPARALRELNRQAPVPSRPDPEGIDEDSVNSQNSLNNNTILQTDKPTGQQTSKPTIKPTNQPSNTQTVKQTSKPRKAVIAAPIEPAPIPIPEPAPAPARVDGRTMRVRQETADKTLVTSMRLAVSTIEALDNFCWKHRQRKQDVVQAALDMYFAAAGEDE